MEWIKKNWYWLLLGFALLWYMMPKRRGKRRKRYVGGNSGRAFYLRMQRAKARKRRQKTTKGRRK